MASVVTYAKGGFEFFISSLDLPDKDVPLKSNASLEPPSSWCYIHIKVYMSQTQDINCSTKPESQWASPKPQVIEGTREVHSSQLPAQHSRQLTLKICSNNGAIMGSLHVSAWKRQCSFLMVNAWAPSTRTLVFESWLCTHPLICVTSGKLFNLSVSISSSIKIGVILVTT